ncbi:MAG: PAS domain S-box protein, partial [Bdellovibrionales bacterium]|nr:PAS domain S-box protein [Bdellovibrionales bacterium]
FAVSAIIFACLRWDWYASIVAWLTCLLSGVGLLLFGLIASGVFLPGSLQTAGTFTWILSPQANISLFLSGFCVLSLENTKARRIFSPFLGVLSLIVVGIGFLSFTGYVSELPIAYTWSTSIPQTFTSSLLCLVIGVSCFSFVFWYYQKASFAATDLWRIITIFSTLGVLTLSIFSIIFVAMPFYSYIQILPNSQSTALLMKQLFQFCVGALLFALMGAAGFFLLCRELVRIAEKHRAEAIRRQEVTTAIVDNAPDGIVRVDAHGKIGGINPAAEDLFNKKGSELVGTDIRSIMRIASEDRSLDTLLEQFSEAKHFGVDHSAVQVVGIRRGEQFPVEVSVSETQIELRSTYILFVRDTTERVQIQKRLEESILEKEVLLKEIHHRVKNNLQIISSLFKLQSGSIEDRQSLKALRDSRNRVRSMALLHELLYRKGNLAEVNFGAYLKELVDQLLSSNGADKEITLDLEADQSPLDIDLAIPCGLITNELVTNSLQHAFPEKRQGKVLVSFRRNSNGTCILEVRDNGAGFSEKSDRGKGNRTLGHRLIQRLSKQIRAEVQHLGPPGYGMRFTFSSETKEQLKLERSYGTTNISC